MKIAFFSNYYNHHQDALSKEFYKITNGNFRFIALKQLPEYRLNLGYPVIERPYVILYSENAEEANKWINEAYVLIFGSVPEKLIKRRIYDRDKITFRYSERPLKNGTEWWKYIYRFIMFHYRNPHNKNLFLLCASSYTALDYSLFALFKNKSYKWGYFPKIIYYDNIKELILKKNKTEILWCGRLIDWKHPDDVIMLANKLKKNNLNFHIKIIGDGEMKAKLKDMCSYYSLDKHITFLGNLPNDKVAEEMEQSGLFISTSDIKEGWGAVLNEAMSRGCAVIASKAAGSTDYLIDNGKNGYSYEYGNMNELYNKTVCLLSDTNKQYDFGLKAYETIRKEWNAEVAAKRLVEMTKNIMDNKKIKTMYLSGPCSEA